MNGVIMSPNWAPVLDSRRISCPSGTLIDSGLQIWLYSYDNPQQLDHLMISILSMCYEPASSTALYSGHRWKSGLTMDRSRATWKSVYGEEHGKYLAGLYNRNWQKGHLTPDADISNLHVLKNSTYYYENAAPQLPEGNTNTWRTLENYIRNNFAEATIFTGTSDGTGQLVDVSKCFIAIVSAGLRK